MRGLARPALQLGMPVLLLAVTAVIAGGLSKTHQLEFENALVMTAIVVALYVFMGNSGVISFGHVSFVAVGAYLAGLLTVDPQTKAFTMPQLFGVLRHAHIGTLPSLALAALVGSRLRARGRAATHAPVGLARRHRDLRGARHHLQRPLLLAEDGTDGADALGHPGDRPVDDRARSDHHRGRRVRIPASRFGRQLRATREDPAAARASGISIYRQRLLAFTVSGALAGLAGGLYVHELGMHHADLFYLDLTFVTLAMLVFGGIESLWGAVVGALVDQRAQLVPRRGGEHGQHVGFTLDLPNGTRLVAIGAVMALVLILRPSGLTGGREFGSGWRR